ncbi:pilus assembly protein TadG-related protein [Pseudomonas fluorescens]|uniref:pilus assembly protein TadG-related protein n=1 Tax=Pseudomonas fluorescens TaxID=294 RepID=UPI001BEAA3E5|nr:pilus assembly protein TadG-related protein [Pseudomonas fluorescens]MBT2372238.1 hypothetical protein [Pseudomonas fluorescens]
MFRHGSGPARQRGMIGLMGALTLGLALLLLLLVVDSGRLYLEKRKLQRVADTAALEAVSRGGTCALPANNAAVFARESAARNSFTLDDNRTLATACGTLITGANFLRTFNADPLKADAIQVIVRHRVTTSIAGGIRTLFSTGLADLTTQLTAVAVAAVPLPPMATLTVRSTLLTVDSSKSEILNGLIGGLLGGKLKLDAVGWQGLINTDINLLSYLDALAIELHVSAGDYDKLLNTGATVGQLIQAAIDVLQRGGDGIKVIINSLEAIKLIAAGTEILHLKDLLNIQAGLDKAALDVNLQLFNLIQGFVQLSNKESAVAAELPVNVLGLLGVKVQTKVISPPQVSAIGNPELARKDPLGPNQIYVRTAQIRTLVTVDLPIVGVVNDLLDGVIGLLNALLGNSDSRISLHIGEHLNVALEAASGSSYVTDYSCKDPKKKSLAVVGTTSAVRLMIGQIDPTNLFSSSKDLSVDEFPVVDLAMITCPDGKPCTRQAFAGGGLGLKIDSPIAQTSKPHVFDMPPEVKQPPSFYSFTAANVVGSLSNTLAGIKFISHVPIVDSLLSLLLGVVTGLLSGVLNLLSGLVSGVLAPLLDPIVNNLLAGLGIDLAKVEIGANLTCYPGGRAVLVI